MPSIRAQQQQRPLRRPALLLSALALLSLAGRWADGGAFAVLAAARPARTTAPARVDEKKEEQEGKSGSRRNATSADNVTLQLGDGFPGGGSSVSSVNPPFVECHVMFQDRSGRDEFGSVSPKTVLEEWVLRGDGKAVTSFKNWRRRMVGDTADMRCHQISQQALEEVQCLACVPREGGLPLTPSGSLAPSEPGVFANSFVLTVGGLDQCLAGAFAGSRYCKSGSVAIGL